MVSLNPESKLKPHTDIPSATDRLEKIWVVDHPSDSYHHMSDNRILPNFVTDTESEMGKAALHHPDTAVYQQGLNSVITAPRQGEIMTLKGTEKAKEYRVQGFAINGNGDQIKKVEVTIDGGKTWLYCIREFPEAPVRHGNKFWTWCFWHVDVNMSDIVASSGIRVRAWDTKLLSQPEEPTWNILGSMNNAQYIVKPETVHDDEPHVLFRHPVEAGNGASGWMKSNTDDEGTETSTRSDRSRSGISEAPDADKQGPKQQEASESQVDCQALQKHRWVPSTLLERNWITDDTAVYKFKLPDDTPYMGVGTCQHVEFAFHLKDKMLIRPYGPTNPVFPRDSGVEVGKNKSLHDGCGTFEITVKTHFSDDDHPGGAFSNILANIPIGEQVDMRGPKGNIIYRGRGRFSIFGKERRFKRVSLVLGGTGLSPGFSLLARSILDSEDKTELLVLDGNKMESDILLRDELDHLERISNGKLKITHVLSDAGNEWKGLTGFIDKDMMAEHLFPSSEVNLALLCGPAVMIEKVVRPGLEDLGYVRDRNMFSL